MLLELVQGNDLESLLMSRFEEYGAGHTYVRSALPRVCTYTPPVPRDESGEAILGCRGN